MEERAELPTHPTLAQHLHADIGTAIAAAPDDAGQHLSLDFKEKAGREGRYRVKNIIKEARFRRQAALAPVPDPQHHQPHRRVTFHPLLALALHIKLAMTGRAENQRLRLTVPGLVLLLMGQL